MNTTQMLNRLTTERLPKDAIFLSDEDKYTYVARMSNGRFVCTTTAPYRMDTYDALDALRTRLNDLYPDGMRWQQRPVLGIEEERALRTTGQVAAELGVNDSRVRQLAEARGVGIHIGRDWRFRPEDVNALRDRKPGRPARQGKRVKA